MKILALFQFYFWLTLQIGRVTEPVPTHYRMDCRLYSSTGQLVANFPGYSCEFASDGWWLAIDGYFGKIYDSSNTLKFQFKDPVHHEMKFSRDEQKIYFLSAEQQDWKDKRTKFDIINIADRQGNILAQWKTSEHLHELYEKLDLLQNDWQLPLPMNFNNLPFEITHEFSHLNAISEIPPNPLEMVLPYLKRGNLLVTFNGLGALVVFDEKLSRIEHVFDRRLLGVNIWGFHDAQILPNGHLLMFKNVNSGGGKPYTSINEYDLLFEKEIYHFKFEPPEFGYNDINGTVQLLPDDRIVLSENSHGGRIVEMSREGIIYFQVRNDRKDPVTKLPSNIYRGKKIAAEKFLSNNVMGVMSR